MLGEAVGGSRREGAEVRYRFYKAHPAFQKLVETMRERAKTKKYLVGLDGRKLFPRSQHSVLNLWIQNATVTVAKKAALIHCQMLNSEGITNQLDYHLLAHLHDEWQIECPPSMADEVGHHVIDCIKRAGEQLSFRCPLDGSYHIGDNWNETH
jgi:DNA polymerase I-like protein with 3'-5' exonuclease and polymerase domains